MEDWKSSFSFAVFFTAAVRDNSALTNYDAVNMLLHGYTFSGSTSSQTTVSSTMATHYIRGYKAISKEVATSFIKLSTNERIKRIESVGLSNIGYAVNAILGLLNSDHIIISEQAKSMLLGLPYSRQPMRFLSDAMLEAVKCQKSGILKLTDPIIREIMSFRDCPTPIDDTGDSDNSSVPNDDIRQDVFYSGAVTYATPAGSHEEKVSNDPSPGSHTDRSFSDIDYPEFNGKGKCINKDGLDYYILDDYEDNDYLEYAPTEYIANYLYFITLTCTEPQIYGAPMSERNKTYLLLAHDRYMNGDDLWSAPCRTYNTQFDNRVIRPRTIKMIREYYKKCMPAIENDVKANERQLMFRLGLHGGYSLAEGDTFIEYKKSPSQPDRWKCYLVKHFFVEDVDPADVINLVDPEFFRGYRYFPLTEWEDAAGNISWIKKEGMKLRIPGGLIPENVVRNIIKPRDLKFHAIQVPLECMRYDCSGYLVRIDIINYHRTQLNLLHQNAHSTSKAAEGTFGYASGNLEKEIKDTYRHALMESGIYRFFIEGRTLITALPYKESAENLDKVICTIEDIHQKLCGISALRQSVPGIRCAVRYAESYKYGKLGLGQSEAPEFFGDQVDALNYMAYSLNLVLDQKGTHPDYEFPVEEKKLRKEKGQGFFNKIKEMIEFDEEDLYELDDDDMQNEFPGIILALENSLHYAKDFKGFTHLYDYRMECSPEVKIFTKEPSWSKKA